MTVTQLKIVLQVAWCRYLSVGW